VQRVFFTMAFIVGIAGCPEAHAENFKWVGGYAGISLGAAGYQYNYDDLDSFYGFDTSVKKVNGTAAGLRGGYNWQSGAAVFGVEADINIPFGDEFRRAGINGATNVGETNLFGSINLRAGQAIDRSLVYIAAGGAYTQFFQSFAYSFNGGSLWESPSSVVGLNVGAGVEYAVTDRVIISADYRQSINPMKRADVIFNNCGVGTPCSPAYQYDMAPQIGQMRMGIAYKF
jgi:outer membrane immunogenic protein